MRPNKYPMVISVTTLSSGPHCPSPDGGQCGGGAKIWQSVRNTEAIIIITHTQCMLSAQWPIPWLQYHIIIIHNTNRLWLDTRQNVARWLSRRQWTIPKAWPRLKEQNTLFPSRLGWRCKSIWWVIISPQTVRKLCPGPGLSFHSWVGRGPGTGQWWHLLTPHSITLSPSSKHVGQRKTERFMWQDIRK